MSPETEAAVARVEVAWLRSQSGGDGSLHHSAPADLRLVLDALSTAEAARLAAKARVVWRPIETAPKDGTFFLALKVHPDPKFRPRLFEARYETAPLLSCLLSGEESPRCHNLSANNWDKPTHWMPLPPPPTEASGSAPDA